MSYSIAFTPRAEREYRSLPREVRPRIEAAISSLATTPRPHSVSRLKGREKRYRIRVGTYRIIYEVYDDRLLVLVVEMGHRREVYREMG